MKKILLLSLFSLFCINIYSQQTEEYIYAEIIGYQWRGSSGVRITFDFGKEKIGADKYCKDENEILFSPKSMVDAMNYLSKEGWVFVQSYVNTFVEKNNYDNYVYDNYTHWVIKKTIKLNEK